MNESIKREITAIKEMINQYAISCNTGDFNLWISLWADSGIQMPPNTPARIGKEQIRERSKPTFDQMNFNMAIRSIDEVRVHGDFAFSRCTYTLKITPKAGGETINAEPDGKALTILERQSDGSWKVIYDCFNSNVLST
ncbi:MAG: YybH family protein [Candidatus Hodarchaeales archaeon]|jgi:uncharacterized protein (TIGR02246 family)